MIDGVGGLAPVHVEMLSPDHDPATGWASIVLSGVDKKAQRAKTFPSPL